jgi:uncharacterized protein
MTGREFAWRVLAIELAASTEEERGEGERAASYLLSPLGARMNRVLLAGQLGSVESIGADPAQPFWRGRATDTTGSVAVTAGGFQPRALAALQQYTEPGPALIVGKAHLFRGRDGTTQASVRAEEIRRVAPEELRELELEILRDSVDRLELVERLRAHPAIEEATLRSEGVAPAWIAAARLALRRYPGADLSRFRSAYARAVDRPAGDAVPAAPSPRAGGSPPTRVTRREEPPPVARPPADRQGEAIFLDLVDELAERSDDGYADLKEAVRRASVQGIAEPQVEEILNRLEEDGVLEEPIVGKLRRA